jgi:TonB family protein
VALWFMTVTETPKIQIKPAPPTVTITLARIAEPSSTTEPAMNTPPVKQEIKPIIKTTEKAKVTPALKPETKPTVKPDLKPTLKPALKPINKPKTTPKSIPMPVPTPKPNLNPQKILPPPMPEAKLESTLAIQPASPPPTLLTDAEAKQYQQQLSAWLNQYKTYPKRAKRMRIEGEGILRIQIDRKGFVQTIQLKQSTGNRLLDKAALKTAQNASPFPAMSQNDPRQSMVFEVPIAFLLR